MFSKFFSKKTTTIYPPISGKRVALSEVPDAVFSKRLMGEGFAIKPTSGELFSPMKGKIESIFPTKHAMIIKSDAGIEALLHIGVDTVELAGEGIDLLVKPGQKVDADVQLATLDLSLIENAGKSTDVIVVFPEATSIEEGTFDLSDDALIMAELVNQ